jgi:hypothetical protein
MPELTKEMWRDDMIISRGMIYGKELDEYIWQQREKWAWRGAIAGAIITNIFWMIAVGW